MLKPKNNKISTIFDKGACGKFQILHLKVSPSSCNNLQDTPNRIHLHLNSPICFSKASNLEWKDDFYFIVGADTQYGQFERLGLVDRNKLPEGKKAWYKELELSEKAVSLVNQLEPKPKFMVRMLPCY